MLALNRPAKPDARGTVADALNELLMDADENDSQLAFAVTLKPLPSFWFSEIVPRPNPRSIFP